MRNLNWLSFNNREFRVKPSFCLFVCSQPWFPTIFLVLGFLQISIIVKAGFFHQPAFLKPFFKKSMFPCSFLTIYIPKVFIRSTLYRRDSLLLFPVCICDVYIDIYNICVWEVNYYENIKLSLQDINALHCYWCCVFVETIADFWRTWVSYIFENNLCVLN